MYHPRLYGSFHDMGLKYGTLLRDKANFVLPEISKRKTDFGLKSYTELQQFYPEIIEEIEGFAMGIGDRPENLGAFLLSLGIFEPTGQCSVFAFKNSDSVMVGRNYDMLYEYKKYTESCLVAPRGKNSYISQSDVFIGRSDGINEKGLFIAISFVNGTEVQPGISFHFLVRRILEECGTTSKAIELILSTKVSSATNYLLADSFGDLAAVESAPQMSKVRRPKENERHIHITNQFVTPEMKPYDQGGVAWSKSIQRYNSLKNILATMETMDLALAKEILSDDCVCLDLKKEKFGTIWSVVSDLTNLKIERAETHPRPTRFKPDTRLEWWMNKRKKQGR